jgi:hypothetical protein
MLQALRKKLSVRLSKELHHITQATTAPSTPMKHFHGKRKENEKKKHTFS